MALKPVARPCEQQRWGNFTSTGPADSRTFWLKEKPVSSVYGLCEEAESAGHQREQASRGGGEGFPKAVVPRARRGRRRYSV